MGATGYEIVGVKKYIKIPDRRLISGFLNVNIINHSDNDSSKDDLASAVFSKWSNLGDPGQFAYPWNGQRSIEGDDRDGKLQTFGDYDVMLFFIGGGMTLHNPTFGTRATQSELHGAGIISSATGPATWTDGAGSTPTYDSSERWYLNTEHEHFCHHYVKYVPLARFNNAYSHNHADHKRGHPLKIKKVTGGSYANLGGNATESHEYLYSNGSYDTHDSSDAELGRKSVGDFGGDLNDDAKNTYFTPVDRVKIYAEHQFTIPTHQNGDGSNICYSNGNTTNGNYSHPDVCNLVVDVGFLGIDQDYSGTGSGYQADINWLKTRVNVGFFPFGETASFEVSDSFIT
jgi:hypothetical protein